MLESDVVKAAKLEASIFSEPWSEESFLAAVQNENAYYMIAEENGEIIAQCGYYNMCGEGEILNVAVREDKRKLGLGKEMLKELIQYGRMHGVTAFTLEVRAGNIPAIRLYEAIGFQSLGIRPGFYEHPKEDALIMSISDKSTMI